MRVLDNLAWLKAWETGAGLHPIDQGLLLLQIAYPETAANETANWPLGQRNRALAALYGAHFSSEFQCWTSCPRCGEKLEVALAVSSIASGAAVNSRDPVVVGEHAFRLPNSRDLARIAAETDVSEAALQLLELCRVDGDGVISWREEMVEEIEQKLALADPLAEILLTFNCPACESSCDKPFDLTGYLWAEITALCRRLLAEVHTLAVAYGWSERDILSLSDARRAVYLEMART